MKEHSNKVFVVGLDGGTLDLIRPWAKQGLLPTFKRLLQEGISNDLTVELPPGTVPNWPSFMTGKNAGKHGVVYWFAREKSSWNWSVVNARFIKEKTIWEIVSSKGKRFISINVPLTYPPKPLNGLMITGLLTPPSAKDFTYPSELEGEIRSQVGRYKIYPDEIYRDGGEGKFLAGLMETLDLRFRTSRYLMDRYPWDLFMIVFSETDAVQHALWKLIDTNHPKYDRTTAELYGEGILQIYQKIDQYLERYLGVLEKDTTLVLMSDHGAGPFYQKFYTNNWLREMGLLKLKRSPWVRLKHFSFSLGFTMQNIYHLLFWAGFTKWRRAVDKKESAESLIRKIFLSYRDIDWDQTSAFAFGGLGQIYLNVASGPDGRYEETRTAIMERLRQVIVPGGGPFVEKVFRREDLYSGPQTSILPDIVFKPVAGYLDPGDFEFFSNKIFDEGVGASGSHRQNGLFLLWGRGVNPSGQLREARIHDLAPTVLHLLNLPIPDGMDGRVLAEALQGEWMASHPIRYEKEEAGQKENLIYSEDEEREIRDQLKGLGYLG